jgi:hypothetical protein
VEEGSGTLRGALLGAGAGGALGLLIVVLTAAGAFGEPGVSLLSGRGAFGAVRTILLAAGAAVPLGALIGMGRWGSGREVSDRELERGVAEIVITSDDLRPRARVLLSG